MANERVPVMAAGLALLRPDTTPLTYEPNQGVAHCF